MKIHFIISVAAIYHMKSFDNWSFCELWWLINNDSEDQLKYNKVQFKYSLDPSPIALMDFLSNQSRRRQWFFAYPFLYLFDWNDRDPSKPYLTWKLNLFFWLVIWPLMARQHYHHRFPNFLVPWQTQALLHLDWFFDSVTFWSRLDRPVWATMVQWFNRNKSHYIR